MKTFFPSVLGHVSSRLSTITICQASRTCGWRAAFRHRGRGAGKGCSELRDHLPLGRVPPSDWNLDETQSGLVKFSVSDHQLSPFFLLKRSSPGLQPELNSSSGHGGKVAPGLHRDLPETAGSGHCWLMPSRLGRVSKLQCTGLVRHKKAALGCWKDGLCTGLDQLSCAAGDSSADRSNVWRFYFNWYVNMWGWVKTYHTVFRRDEHPFTR